MPDCCILWLKRKNGPKSTRSYIVDILFFLLAQDYLFAHDVKDGQIKVGLAGIHPIVGSGAVVNLEFEVLETESPKAGSGLEITEMAINEGRIAANIQVERFQLGSSVPDEYALHQNYPNPFNAETMIKSMPLS